jgi:hypothetical protein
MTEIPTEEPEIETPKPETPRQATVKAQYSGFRGYLEADLPEGPDKVIALEALETSYEAAYSAAADQEE